METKTVAKTALACKLLIFNAICALLFPILVVVFSPFYICAGVLQCLGDIIAPIVRENKKLIKPHIFIIKNENTKNHAHVMGQITKEDVRNN